MSVTKPYTALSLDEAYFIDRLNPIHTGVDAPLWISCEDSNIIPQVKAETDGISFTITIDDQQLLFDDDEYFNISTCMLIQLQMWVRLNRQALLDYWKQKIDTASFLCLMIRLPENMVDVSSVNLNESCIFPCEKYKVQVRNCDSTPPNFHVISKEEGYDIRLLLSTGELLWVDRFGKRSRNEMKAKGECFSDVVKAAKEWLSQKPAHPKAAAASSTNREHIEFVWEMNHDYYTE